jgi:hypothetical protein
LIAGDVGDTQRERRMIRAIQEAGFRSGLVANG